MDDVGPEHCWNYCWTTWARSTVRVEPTTRDRSHSRWRTGRAGAPAVTLLIGGDARIGLPQYLELAEEPGVALVSVEYRLAPEHPHSALVEDCRVLGRGGDDTGRRLTTLPERV